MPENEVILLKEENEKQSIELRADDTRVIKDIMKYLNRINIHRLTKGKKNYIAD